jgi:o-succinylbenzoate synthase
MLKARYFQYTLNFKVPSGTSRGVLTEKPSWYILITDSYSTGIGEISIIPGLSVDDPRHMGKILDRTCRDINEIKNDFPEYLDEFPAIRFGVETALKDLENKGTRVLFPSAFTEGKQPVKINGLIWMGHPEVMDRQIKLKIDQGFRCIKIKIGAIDFEDEINLLKKIRKKYKASDIELRVDANGAFTPENALEKLNRLSQLDIHSIEQPIKPGQIDIMTKLCESSPLPIALDEELIGINSLSGKEKILDTILPNYIIIKPGLVGGFTASEEWIGVAENLHIDWWITSALESNIGLNAISQWTYSLNNQVIHGLGTGSLYSNNIPSPLTVQKDGLYYLPESSWDLKIFDM